MTETLQRPLPPRPGLREEPTWDLVVKRNYVERLKREKFPLDVRNDLPELIEQGYENISEEDIVRLQWWGLYHDKPKVGTFMMRIKIPNGILSPQKLRTIGEISNRYGRGYGELSTRQNIQLHWIELAHLPDIFATLERNGLTTAGGCGDTVRNITGCPVSGIDREELFDAWQVALEAAEFFYGNPEYSDLPRKHKITIAACPYQCNLPEMHCIALIGVKNTSGGRERLGFAVRIGGGLSTAPRLSQDMGVFVELQDAIPVLGAILDVWKSDLRYRVSRVKARFKFMVDDYGAAGVRQKVEERLGSCLEDFTAPPPIGYTTHLGVHPQKQEGLNYIGFPVHLGLVTGDQMLRLADLIERYPTGEMRLTRQQNFILSGIPVDETQRVIDEVAEIGFPLDVHRLRGESEGCTGDPHCNYSVTETKARLAVIIEHLEKTFGRQVEGLRLHLDGCPHSCCHHWLGDIGIQGTTARERGEGGEKLQAYDIYLRGGVGLEAAIGTPLIRRVPSDQLHLFVERLVRAWLSERQDGETFKRWADRKSDEELVFIASAGTMQVPRRVIGERRGAAAAAAQEDD
jgi:sulfite reductase beta subunit-like hemoprotein